MSADIERATLWFLTARGMTAACANQTAQTQLSAAGLFAQSVLGFSEDVCIEGKSPARIERLSLIDCLAGVAALPIETREKFLTGALMIALLDRKMDPSEVRWASALASAMRLNSAQVEECCLGARILTDMLHPVIPMN
ncbi:MAG: hypothetical protein EXS17_06090 [Phycisphaerales bacterium]|nr:hypothetical protein [Phycisphaerales bacterium]